MWEMAKGMFKDIFGAGDFSVVVDILKFNPSSQLVSAWTAVDAIYNDVMVPIALGLMIIWFLVKLMERSANEQLSIEQFFMLFVKLIAAKFLIDHGLQIFTDMWSLGIAVIDEVSAAFSGSAGPVSLNVNALWKDFTGFEWGKEKGIWASIGVMFQLVLPWLASKIIIAVVYFICYSRLIEMLVRMCGAPIALSDFMNEGLHGAGWRYLKNFLAICLQGILILAISRLYGYVYSDIFSHPPGGFWNTALMQIAVSFAAVALMFKSLSISKELLGTG